MKNADMPAMPCKLQVGCGNYGETREQSVYGVTKREDFTKAAMVALLSNHSMIDGCTDVQVEWLVETAVVIADAQLAKLGKK